MYGKDLRRLPHVLLATELLTPGGGSARGQTRQFLLFKPNLGDNDGCNRVEEAVLSTNYKPVLAAHAAKIWEYWYDLTEDGCQHGEDCKVGPSCTYGARMRPLTLVTGAVLPIWHHIADVIQGGREQSNAVVVFEDVEGGKKGKGRPAKCVRVTPAGSPSIIGLQLEEPDEVEMLREALM